MPLPPPIEPRVDLLPVDDPDWEWKRFERFCLGLAGAQPDVKSAPLYGKRGEKQHGIDIVADLVDGRTRTYQCRKRRRFTKRDAEKVVTETTYDADDHVIVVTCEVGIAARDYVDELPTWDIWDKEDLAQRVREIDPRERGRRLVEDSFGVNWRKAFLGPRTSQAFYTADDFFEPFLREDRLFRHTWQLVGREDVVGEVLGAIDAAEIRVAVLVGRGGIGKTRLLKEVGDRTDEAHTVLFTREGADLTDEAVDELPLADTVLVLDDAHRRDPDELAPLLSVVRDRDHPVTLVLATRPQRVDELRGGLARAGFASNQIWVSSPIPDLALSDVEELARQALGPDLAHLAPGLGAATADCPLVTVFGGQLLAREAIGPALLERHEDFRAEVLERFRDERLGQLNPEVDPDAAREALVLLSALQPISVADERTMQTMAVDLGLDEPYLNVLLSELEDAGLLLARGRFRRIIPDVLADHILYRACIDRQGRPTGRADQLLQRNAEIALTPLLRNLSELDWRVGQEGEPADLLASVWDEVAETFRQGDAGRRIQVIGLIGPVAQFQPDRVIELVEYGFAHPATTVDGLWGYSTTDDDFRHKLPPLLRSAGYSPKHTRRAMQLLWTLARDDSRDTNPHPDHAMRVLVELGTYELGHLFYPETLFEVATESLAEPDDHYRSTLALLAPLLAREGTRTRSEGHQIQIGRYDVNAEVTADLRRRVRDTLKSQCLEGSDRGQYLAADILGDALRQPMGLGGGSVPRVVFDSWLPDQLETLDVIADVLTTSADAFVRMKLRDGLNWHAEHSAWPEIAERAQALLDAPPEPVDEIITMLVNPWGHALDLESQEKRIRAAAALVVQMEPREALTLIEGALGRLQMPGERTGDPGQFLYAVAETSIPHAEALSRRAVEDPAGVLAPTLSVLLHPLRRNARAVHDELVAMMRGEAALRPHLAHYLSNGTWLEEDDPTALELAREFLTDPQTSMVQTVLVAVMRLGKKNPALACELVLLAAEDTNEEAVERLYAAIIHGELELSDADTETFLERLESVSDLPHHATEFLVRVAASDPDRALQTMLARLRQGAQLGFHPVPFHGFPGDVLGGAEGERRIGLLRRIRDIALDEDAAHSDLARFFWMVSRVGDENLLVLHEWLASGDETRLTATASLIGSIEYGLLLAKPHFVSDVLERAAAAGEEALTAIRAAFVWACTGGGDLSRTLGAPAPRDAEIAQRAPGIAEQFPAGSHARASFESLANDAEARIRESRLEDEEVGEG